MTSRTKALLFFSVFLLLNAAAYAGAAKGFWPMEYALRFYWGESVAIGLCTLILYAKHLLIFFALLGFMIYLIGVRDFLFWSDLKIPLAFWAFYSLCWLIYFEIRKTRLGQAVRLAHPFKQLGFYFFFMTLAITASYVTTGYMFFGTALMPLLPYPLLQRFIVLVVFIPTLTISFLRIVDMVGARHFLHFFLGTYHRPAIHKRIVLFLDMVGSSAVAENQSPVKNAEMIARFVFDACTVFRIYGGDILNFTGDGLVVLWPVDQGNRVMAAIDALHKRLENNREFYLGKFNHVPGFRIGIHSGDVVINQIGEEKLFLGLHGDVVNTAARIEQLNKTLGTNILFSKAFKQRVGFHLQEKIVSKGVLEIPGKQEEVEVFSLAKGSRK